jgi:3-ketosteroid 9alpha-monooxygenase subunit A
MWHDSEGLEPEFPLPEFGNHYGTPGWVNWKIDFMGDVDTHPVEILDNMVDIAHFTPIHGSMDIGYFINEFEDHVVWQHFGSGHRTLVSEAGAMLETRTWYTGPGILQSEMMGGEPSLMFIAHTPIEDGKVRVWHGLMVKVRLRLSGERAAGLRPGRGDLAEQAGLHPPAGDPRRRSGRQGPRLVLAVL